MSSDRVARIAFRLSFFVIAAGALAWVCREGTSLFEVGMAFVVYVAAATLWVRGQYQASVDAAVMGDESLRPWTFRYRTSSSVVAVGGLVAGYGLARDNGTALVVGSLMVYLGSGYLLMRFRIYTGAGGRLRVKVGLLVLGGVTAAVIIGLVLLEKSGLAVIPVASVLFAPIGLSLLAEPAIRRLQEPDRGAEIVAAGGVGLLLFLLDIGIAVARVETAWIAFMALALLVVAIVSSTQADIAVVLAAVALMGVTSQSDDKPEALNPKTEHRKVLVALGDSYMSGEGADIYYREEADDLEKGQENHCHRAPTAWAAMAGQTKRHFDSVAFLACSGARTYNVQHEKSPPSRGPRPGAQYNEPATQLDQIDALKTRLKVDLDPSLVVVSLGGNDAGFSTIGMMCLAPGNCSEKRDLWESNLPDVGRALSTTYDQIRREFPRAPILVTAYPAPIYTDKEEQASCDEVALSNEEMLFVSQFVTRLNDTVERAAAAKRFYFLGGMEQALADAHLQLCDPLNNKRPGINFIGLRSVGGIAEQRFNPANWYHNSLHPNERGHAAALQVFEQWRAEHPDPARDAPATTAAGATSTEGGTPQPPCDLVKDSQSTAVRCVDAGAAWARGQLSDMFLWNWWGLQVAVATLAAWLLAVALFGYWKPWWRERPDD